MRTAAILIVLATSTAASAQFVSLDRQSRSRRVGVRLDFGFPKDGEEKVTADDVYFRTELYGQFTAAGFGGYISVPFMKDIGSNPIATADATLGNIEVGGYKVIGAGPIDLVARIGLTLPTARDSAAAGLYSFGRLTDLLNQQPGIFAVRLSLSPDIKFGVGFLRADIGADFLFDRDGDEPGRRSFASQLRANVGGGVNLGLVAFSAEIVNLIGITDGNLARSEGSAHTLALSGWANLPIVKPFVAFTFPLDEQNRAAYGFAFTLGVEGVIP